jgi:hypothetical protein
MTARYAAPQHILAVQQLRNKGHYPLIRLKNIRKIECTYTAMRQEFVLDI